MLLGVFGLISFDNSANLATATRVARSQAAAAGATIYATDCLENTIRELSLLDSGIDAAAYYAFENALATGATVDFFSCFNDTMLNLSTYTI